MCQLWMLEQAVPVCRLQPAFLQRCHNYKAELFDWETVAANAAMYICLC